MKTQIIKKLLISGILLLSNLLVFSQAKLKGNVMINGGLSMSNLYSKVFVLGLKTETNPLYPRSQKSAFFFDFNVSYIFASPKWICKPIVGLGYTPIGFDEEGTTLNDSQKIVAYYVPVKFEFKSVYGGLSYTLFSKKNIKIWIYQTINPLFNFNKSIPVIKKFGVSARTSFTADVILKSGGVICITPFFQTCITKFNKNKTIRESPNYYPYSYGLNIGTYFKH